MCIHPHTSYALTSLDMLFCLVDSTSILVVQLHLQMNFSNNSIGFLLNGVYSLNLTLTFITLHTGRLSYLSELLQHHTLVRSLRSSSSH